METTDNKPNRKGPVSRAGIAVAFAVHQIIATLGVMVATPFVLALVAPVLRFFGLSLSLAEGERILTGMHYFPLQAAFGFLLGCALGYNTRHRSAQWVWMLPALILFFLVVTNHHIADLRPAAAQFSASALSHFFGNDCGPASHCFDQIGFTLPLYCAVAYSVGALAGRKLWLRARRQPTAQLART
jgi:hypothetical protein